MRTTTKKLENAVTQIKVTFVKKNGQKLKSSFKKISYKS